MAPSIEDSMNRLRIVVRSWSILIDLFLAAMLANCSTPARLFTLRE